MNVDMWIGIAIGLVVAVPLTVLGIWAFVVTDDDVKEYQRDDQL